MAREQKERAHGPYPNRGKWRVVIVGAGGGRAAKTYSTEQEALAVIAAFRGQVDTRTIQGAVDAYLQHLRDRSLRSSTVTRQEYQLRLMLNLESNGKRKLRWVNPARAVELYDRAKTKGSVDTHRNALSVAKAWGRWCSAKTRGWLKADPFAEIKGVGRRKKGKPQPRVDESRVYLDHCLAAGAAGDQSAVAIATVLLLGTRSSEVAERDVRDLDDGGRLLWIPDAKTDSGRRTIEVPDVVRSLLLSLAKGRKGNEPLFRKRDGERADRHWMHRHAARLAKDARVGVKVIPQALRGLHGTLARLGGSTSELVAKQLGHASTEMTEGGAYVDQVAVADKQRSANLKVLMGGRR